MIAKNYKKISKIIFLIYSPFTKRDYKRFGFEILQANGFEVEVWDFTPFLNPDGFNKVQMPDSFDYQGKRVFYSMKNALKAISGLSEDVFIMNLLPYSLKSVTLYRALSECNLRYAVLVVNALPSYVKSNKKKQLITKLKRITLKKLTEYLFRKIPFIFLGIKPANLIIAGGENSIKGSTYPVDNTSKILWGHALDYDIYMQIRDEVSYKSQTYAVFLDEYLPFHPDYIHLGIAPYTSAEEYYPLLCSFFDILEKQNTIKIVIAAHPSSCYDNHPDYFRGRTVIRGKTAQLVKNSKFVIAHCSTSINFAVLLKKPIVFITTKKISNTVEGMLIEYMAHILDKKVIELDNNVDLDITKEMTINEEKYNHYINAYIKKKGTEDLPLWQIVANRLKNWEN